MNEPGGKQDHSPPPGRRSFQDWGFRLRPGENWSRHLTIDSSKTLNVAEFTSSGWQVSHSRLAKNRHSDLFEQLRRELRRSFVAKMLICFTDFSLWFSLPLSIWLSTGWIGLIFHWRANSKMVCQVENAPQDAAPRGEQYVGPLMFEMTCAPETGQFH